jgi:hypothetical protein
MSETTISITEIDIDGEIIHLPGKWYKVKVWMTEYNPDTRDDLAGYVLTGSIQMNLDECEIDDGELLTFFENEIREQGYMIDEDNWLSFDRSEMTEVTEDDA